MMNEEGSQEILDVCIDDRIIWRIYLSVLDVL